MITEEEFMDYANHPVIGYLFNNPRSPWGERGLEIGPGWYDISLLGLHWIARNDPDKIVRLAQLKNKFGGMRFYIDYECDDVDKQKQLYNQIHTIPNIIEHMASIICESCGSMKKLNYNALTYNKCGCIGFTPVLTKDINYVR